MNKFDKQKRIIELVKKISYLKQIIPESEGDDVEEYQDRLNNLEQELQQLKIYV